MEPGKQQHASARRPKVERINPRHGQPDTLQAWQPNQGVEVMTPLNKNALAAGTR